MHEREPWLDWSALRRFEADLYYAEIPFDLYNAFVTYMERQFDITEEAAMKLQWHVQREGELPDVTAEGVDPAIAHEQTRLALIRIALPFAESLIGDDDVFKKWVHEASVVAMGIENSPHEIDACVLHGSGMSCEAREVCPVRTVKYALVLEATSPSFDSPDYAEEWSARKIRRTLAKLDVALRLGLSVPEETKALRRNYLFRSKTRGVIMPDESDI